MGDLKNHQIGLRIWERGLAIFSVAGFPRGCLGSLLLSFFLLLSELVL